jgi:hypothetical protein
MSKKSYGLSACWRVSSGSQELESSLSVKLAYEKNGPSWSRELAFLHGVSDGLWADGLFLGWWTWAGRIDERWLKLLMSLCMTTARSSSGGARIRRTCIGTRSLGCFPAIRTEILLRWRVKNVPFWVPSHDSTFLRFLWRDTSSLWPRSPSQVVPES